MVKCQRIELKAGPWVLWISIEDVKGFLLSVLSDNMELEGSAFVSSCPISGYQESKSLKLIAPTFTFTFPHFTLRELFGIDGFVGLPINQCK